MDRVLQPAGASRTPVVRVAGRPPLRIRLPGRVAAATAPRTWFRLTRLSLAGSAVVHTAAIAALLQVPGVGDRAARAGGEILHVVYLGRMAEPKPEPPPPPPPPPEPPRPEPVQVEPAAVVMPDPPPPPAVVEPIPVVVTNATPVVAAPEPLPPPPAAETVQPPAGTPVEQPATTAPEPAVAIEDGPAWDAVRTAIHRHLAYPDAARRRGEEGRVVLQLIVGPEGRLEQAGVLADGASDRLVAAALAAARRAAPFGATARGAFHIPIVFRLAPAAGL